LLRRERERRGFRKKGEETTKREKMRKENRKKKGKWRKKER
jgi:hypothetical protein